MLDLAISSRACHRRLVHTDVMTVTEVQELFAGELGAVVGDDDVGYPKPVDDVGEEKDGLLGARSIWRICRWPPANGCILPQLSVEGPRGRDPTPRMTT